MILQKNTNTKFVMDFKDPAHHILNHKRLLLKSYAQKATNPFFTLSAAISFGAMVQCLS